jgi:hypothetical protein
MDISTSSLTLLDQLQSDIVGRLGADEFFADVPVLAQNKGVIEDDIAQALATMTEQAGKSGAAVVVLLPERSTPKPNIPGPRYDLSIVIRAMELPLINRGDAGTGKTCTALSLRIEHLLHQLPMDGVLLRASRTGGLQQESGGLACDVTIEFEFGLPAARRVQTPGISLADGVATILCGTSGATIRYTTDGSYPGSSAIAYSAPVTLTDGQTIRAVAEADGYQASPLSQTTYTA